MAVGRAALIHISGAKRPFYERMSDRKCRYVLFPVETQLRRIEWESARHLGKVSEVRGSFV
jgi:hypothetical protein